MVLKYMIAWVGMVFIAIINGAIRESGYKKFMGDLRAHQVSTITAIILFGLFIWLLTSIWPIQSTGQAIAIGFVWLILTVAFEFIFGHFVMKHPWKKLLNDYNILEGRLWVLVLIWITIAPYLFYKLN